MFILWLNGADLFSQLSSLLLSLGFDIALIPSFHIRQETDSIRQLIDCPS